MSKKEFSKNLDAILEFIPQQKSSSSKNADKKESKWTKLVKVNVLLEEEQKDLIDSLSKRVMRSRKNGTERITSNTILRCLISLLEKKVSSLDVSNISSEEDLKRRISEL